MTFSLYGFPVTLGHAVTLHDNLGYYGHSDTVPLARGTQTKNDIVWQLFDRKV